MALEEACARFPDEEPLHGAYARMLGRLGRVDDALEQVRRWAPSPWTAKLALKLLTRHGRAAEAGPYEAAVASTDPSDPTLVDSRAARLGEQPEALLRYIDDVLERDPGAVHALYYKCIALAALGRDAEAEALMALDRLVRTGSIPLPAGFADEQLFLRELRAEIGGNSSLHEDPAGHASRKGLRTRSFPPQDRATHALVREIKAQVAAYASSLPGHHPFAAAPPKRTSFSAWALIFGASGHQVLHHHPGAWVTGVYYVSAPPSAPPGGALRIGGLPAWAKVDPPWKVIDVEPLPGRLVLFPSYVPHETIPTQCDGERISVAFDVADADRTG
jgi:uncharacterized protein (TIGR02466 family)